MTHPRGAANPLKPQSAKEFTLHGQRVAAERLSPGLHVVATPIGNLKDVTLRALGTLAGADAILAEDTRVTAKLLTHYGVATPTLAYHEHNAARLRPMILSRLREGEAIAIVSDAGTPLISDPGFKLVADAVAAGIAVTSAPGASALLAALTIAGLPTDRFFFEGFLPPKSAARRARLAELASIPATLVFYEAPSRIAEMIADAADMLGSRDACAARELTKLHEEALRGPLHELAAQLAERDSIRGEIVVLIAPPGADAADDPASQEAALDEALRAALASSSLKQAVADVAAKTGQPRRVVYARALALSGKS
ncbi:16S rRNA (cytidine(1402)-2'-O)-methyltransferase [Terrarubrum flagellatum]|uniref:16S rRNA (cytidine(1402)-2'-O)-methyltransferase n=1 Tax=Terrirubrum flagellatum TaxID=2895980 RepID=UPI003144E211